MKAIYKNQRCIVVENHQNYAELSFYTHDHPLRVDWGDPDLIIDPTDEQWANAN